MVGGMIVVDATKTRKIGKLNWRKNKITSRLHYYYGISYFIQRDCVLLLQVVCHKVVTE